MSKITNLMTIMTKAQELNDFIRETEITTEDISHFCALEPEMTTTIESLLLALTTTTTTTTDTTDITIEPKEEVEVIAPPIVTETIAKPIVETIETTTESTETWKKTSSGVEVSSYGNVRYNGEEITPKMVGGYTMFYDPVLKKYQPLAKTVLTVFTGAGGKSACPLYKDGNRSNCSCKNLSWGMRNPNLSTGQVEKACKIISENPKMKESDLVNILVEAGAVRSSGGLKSILAGNYKTISDKYFICRGGSIIPVKAEDTEATDTTTTIANKEQINIDDIRNNYISLIMGHKHITTGETSDFILTYLMDGCNTAEEIQKAIHRDFGRKIMITTSQIKDIIGK